MHYELYVDSLFFLNFIMNLYLLMLVNKAVIGNAGTGRMLAGAAVGATCFLFPFLMDAPPVPKLLLGIAAGTAGMLCITFSVRSLRMFLRLLEKMVLYSFGIGGAMLFLVRCLPGIRNYLTGVAGILGMGSIFFLLFRRFRCGPDMEHCLCTAVLHQDERQIKVTALIDSGNSLTEPISGKPVCIVGREVFDGLWEKGGSIFRAIPYHSIGKRRGILPGYLLSRLQLEVEDMKYVFNDVYVAVSEEVISGTGNNGAESVNMIINPGLFAEGVTGSRKKRQNERHNDSESNNTRQDSV